MLLLGREEVAPLQRMAFIIEKKAWADHAFKLQHWSWAIEGYIGLYESSKNEASGLKRYALFKLGYAWGEFALSIRGQKILDKENNWRETYEAAEKAQKESLRCYNEFRDSLNEIPSSSYRPASFYNLSCTYSVNAQLVIEKELGVKADHLGWENFVNWRENKRCELIKKKVQGNLESSMSNMEKFFMEESNDERMKGEISWLIDNIDSDNDLLMLRFDPVFGEKLEKLKKNRKPATFLDSLKYLKKLSSSKS